MDALTLLGILGTTLIFIGFAGNRMRYWTASDKTYVVLNAVGSLLLIVYSYLIDSYPFIVLNAVWLIFSLKDLLSFKK
jgi:hypothetical protein